MKSQKELCTNNRHASNSRRLLVAACALASVALFSAQVQAQAKTTGANFSFGAASVQTKRDSMTITLVLLARTEVKLEMTKGQKAEFSWKSEGVVTYNLHSEGPDAPGGKAHSYMRGESKAETGEIVALFDGVHGWSWRNTSEKPVKVTVAA